MIGSGWKRHLQATLLSLLIITLFSARVTAHNNLEVHFIDVGQGESELIRFNNKNILIDGGEPDMGGRVESYREIMGFLAWTLSLQHTLTAIMLAV